jgi:hypothetical protein
VFSSSSLILYFDYCFDNNIIISRRGTFLHFILHGIWMVSDARAALMHLLYKSIEYWHLLYKYILKYKKKHDEIAWQLFKSGSNMCFPGWNRNNSDTFLQFISNFIEFTQSTVYESAYSKSSEYVEEKGRKFLCRLFIYSIRVLSKK